MNFLNKIKYLPSIGIVIFYTMYYVATLYYPGGSKAFPDAIHFDWINNYWCDLTDAISYNGKFNQARFIALFGMTILCSSIAFFFYLLPIYFQTKSAWKWVTQYLGMGSMICALLIFTSFHNIMILVSSLMAFLPLVGIFVILKHHQKNKLLYIGYTCLLLMAVNNFIYYSSIFIEHLALIQKISFVIVLTWVISLNLHFDKLKLPD